MLLEVVAALLFWEFVGHVLEFRPSILPTPSRILLELWRESPMLQRNGQATFEEIVLGLLIAVLIAMPVAYLIALFRRADPFVAPFLLVMHRAPLVALAPVLLTWFSVGMLPKTLIVMLMAFFPAVENILIGLRSIPKEMTELLRIMQAGRLQILFRVYVPGSLHGLFYGLKSAVWLAVSGATVAEFVAADQGLGYLMLSGISKMDAPLVFAALTILTAIGFVCYVVVILLERTLISWHVEIAGRTGVWCRRHA